MCKYCNVCHYRENKLSHKKVIILTKNENYTDDKLFESKRDLLTIVEISK